MVENSHLPGQEKMSKFAQRDHNILSKLLLIKCHSHKPYFNLTRWKNNKIHHVKMQQGNKGKHAVCFHEGSQFHFSAA